MYILKLIKMKKKTRKYHVNLKLKMTDPYPWCSPTLGGSNFNSTQNTPPLLEWDAFTVIKISIINYNNLMLNVQLIFNHSYKKNFILNKIREKQN